MIWNLEDFLPSLYNKNMDTQQTKKVEIYSTPFCAYCKMAKEYFKNNSVDYTEYDVAKDAQKRQELVDRTHQFGVPVIVIDGKIVVGFDRPKINELLGI